MDKKEFYEAVIEEVGDEVGMYHNYNLESLDMRGLVYRLFDDGETIEESAMRLAAYVEDRLG